MVDLGGGGVIMSELPLYLVFREGHVERLFQRLARLRLRGLQAIDQLFWE